VSRYCLITYVTDLTLCKQPDIFSFLKIAIFLSEHLMVRYQLIKLKGNQVVMQKSEIDMSDNKLLMYQHEWIFTLTSAL
jgi:hypothetical protein